MKVVIQRVKNASVEIDSKVFSSIKHGYLILLGIENEDAQDDINWLVTKISNLRIFNDEDEKMNLSLLDVNGEALVVSQFTLHASTKKGNRPSFIQAAKPDIAIPLYENFVTSLSKSINKEVKTGEFGADMKVNLLNDGPVTIIIDTKDKK